MKRTFTLFAILVMLAFTSCEVFGGDDFVDVSHSVSGAVQKGPFIQGSSITIQPLNEKLKPIGQMYTTQTTNDAGMFEIDNVHSKYAEIIATGYYFDEVEGEISSSMLTLRSIADIEDNSQKNVNLLTTITYNRIKNLVSNDGKSVTEASCQAEKELFTALGIPENIQPSVSCGAMNISNSGEENGLLLAITIVLQNGRSVGELSEYIAKFSSDLADDGTIQQELLQKLSIYGFHSSFYEEIVIPNLVERYNSLGIECSIPNFSQYLPYLNYKSNNCACVVYFKYDKTFDNSGFNEAAGRVYAGIDNLYLNTDVDLLGYEYFNGYGAIYLSDTPKVISRFICDAVSSITIPDSVTSIGESAFSDCSMLSHINIPLGITSISDSTFSGCSSLQYINIPSTVTSIGNNAFRECALYDISFPDGLTSIGANAFHNCRNLMVATIPNSVTSIGEGAFSGCAYMTIATLPSSIVSIPNKIFSDCLRLFEVIIPNSVVSIGESAFYNCTGLTSFTIPKRVNSIGNSAFRNCENLQNVYCEPMLPPSAGTSIFDNNSPNRVIYVPTESVETYCKASNWERYKNHIASYDFNNGDEITKIYYTSTDGKIVEPWTYSTYASLIISNIYKDGQGIITLYGNVKEIGEHLFSNCNTLASITIPNGVTSIRGSAFANCTSLTSITIPESVTSIEIMTFSNCTSLADITIPDSVTSIGSNAFHNCTKLTSISIPNSVTIIEDSAFSSCSSLVSASISDSITSIGTGTFHNCPNLTNFSGLLASDDGRCLIVNGAVVAFAPSGLTEYTIQDGTTSIKDNTFSVCRKLESITIPDSITSIGWEAFVWDTKLIEVYCKPTTPPQAIPFDRNYWWAFNGNAPERKIYVPRESVEAYKSADGWSDYADAIVGYDFK